MFKKDSIRRCILWSVAEIVIGTVGLVVSLMLLVIILEMAGQINLPSSNISLDLPESSQIGNEKLDLANLPYDYVLFDKENQLVEGNYMTSDWTNFQSALQEKNQISNGTDTYVYLQNDKYQLVVRLNSLPEFRSHALRKIPYNLLSHWYLIFGEIILIIWSLSRLIRIFLKNFLVIQEMTDSMSHLFQEAPKTRSTIREFDSILVVLREKREELASLMTAEIEEKQDLSFQVAALSHDLKTPLTVLKGNIELLEMTSLSQNQLEYTQAMTNSVETFEKYLHTLVSYSCLLSEEISYNETINLTDFLEDLSFDIADMMTTHQVNYYFGNDATINQFKGNAFQLSRALVNILSNASQYAKLGDKKVRLTILEDSLYLIFEVWNNGHPFSDKAIQEASKLFYTEDTSRSGKHYGIGLAFTHVVATRHHGKLELYNAKNGGATVRLMIRK